MTQSAEAKGFPASLLTTNGRLAMGRYWRLVGIVLAGPLAILALMTSIAVALDTKSLVLVVPLVIVGVASLVVLMLLSVRRLHDRNKSGHWLWLFFVLPALLLRFATASQEQGHAAHSFVFGTIALALIVWAFVEIGLRQGTSGANRFGPAPLAGS